MSAHTPGPWSLAKGIEWNSWLIEINRSSWSRVWGSIENQPEVDANARLIAAAPELLLALEYLHENCDSTGPYPGGLRVLEMVERALKKARGE